MRSGEKIAVMLECLQLWRDRWWNKILGYSVLYSIKSPISIFKENHYIQSNCVSQHSYVKTLKQTPPNVIVVEVGPFGDN